MKITNSLKILTLAFILYSGGLFFSSSASAYSASYKWQGLKLQMKPNYAKLFISRMGRVNPDFQKLVSRASRRHKVEVRISGPKAPSGGNYTATHFSSEGTDFEVGLNLKNFRLGNQLGFHLQMHELSHVVANSFAYGGVYARYFDFWQRSPAWRSCYPQKSPPALEPCVGPDEIFADQLAFWATGNGRIRSSYKLPPLAKYNSMNRLVRTSGLWRQAGLR